MRRQETLAPKRAVRRCRCRRRKFLDDDVQGGIPAERKARSVDSAQDRTVAGDFGDKGGFPQTHLANALAEVGISLQFAYKTCRTPRQLAEGSRIFPLMIQDVN